MVRLTLALSFVLLCLTAAAIAVRVMLPAPPAEVSVLAINREGDTHIYAKDATNAVTQRLTHTGTFNGIPQVSPDGAWIAFISNRAGNTEVYVMDRFGGDARNISQHADRDHNPYWTIDSQYLRFSSEREGRAEWYVANLASGEVRRLADTTIPTPQDERACRSSGSGGAWSTCNRGDDDTGVDDRNALP